MLFKYTVEVVGVLEACDLGYFIYFKIRIKKQRTAYVKFYLSEDLGKGKSGRTSYQLTYIRHRIVKMLRQFFKSYGTVVVLNEGKYL